MYIIQCELLFKSPQHSIMHYQLAQGACASAWKYAMGVAPMEVGSAMHPFRLLVITSCTKDKVIASDSPANAALTSEELWDGREDNRAARHYGDLERRRLPAGQLYRGAQHRETMRGVALLRDAFGPQAVEVKIVSAGFGLVDERQPLPPYEATFSGLASSKIKTVSASLGIPASLRALLAGSYSCAFFLLGENYLRSLGLPYLEAPTFPCLFLASLSNQKLVPQSDAYHLIPVGEGEVKAFRYGMVGIKGHLFHLFAQQIVSWSTPNGVSSDDAALAEAGERLARFIENPGAALFQEMLRPLRHEYIIKHARREWCG
ncbi:MAG TPA: hypothetical protein VFV38_10295 [Ktedonobacteraceae bacterium]|nr:hypothetical protein [Ktedonobacteraceae bacterium]